jgi:valyl-tRNA synthetase
MREHIDEIEFHPPRNRQFLLDWMDNISIDWPISRRRWYHTEIPIWYSQDEQFIVVPPTGITSSHGKNNLQWILEFLIEILEKMSVRLMS